MVTFDTTRADHLGAYGHEGARTPVADALAATGTLFEQAMVTVPITLPSHSSIMTGKVPLAHGVRDNGLFALGDEQVTLAEVLRDAGYRTGAAIGAFPLTAQFGIDQGFEHFDDHLTSPYEDIFGEQVLPKTRLFFDERPAARVNEALLPWLERHLEAHVDQPFFAWLHYFDPHHPHEPPAPYDQLFVHDLYDGEIAYADESLGRMLDHLERLGVRDRTLVVLTSDHGEGRGEHDESTHSMLIYQSTLRVPLIFHMPGDASGRGRGRRIGQRVSTIDILPTILDLLDIAPPEGIQGVSLRPLLEGRALPDRQRALYAETLSPRLSRDWGELRALVLDDNKYIHGPRPELYDLAADPHELDDRVADRPELAEQMRRRLARYLSDHAAPDLDSSVAVDEETVRRLRALGYLQSTGDRVGAIVERLREDGDPPQDHAANVTAFSQARQLLFRGKALEAQGFIRDLLRADPDNPYYLEMMVKAMMRLGDHDGALALVDRLSEAGGAYPPPATLLRMASGIHFAAGDVDTGHAKLTEAETLEPTAEGQYQLARFARRLGDPASALRLFDAALELEPALVPARVDRAIQRVLVRDLEGAEADLVQAIADDPFFARAHFNYGALLVETQRLARAADHFRRAARLRPRYLQARAALVEVLVILDRVDQAKVEAEALSALAPQSAEAEIAARLIRAPS